MPEGKGADDNQAGPPLPILLWKLWLDGTALPNPGAMSIGLVLEAPDGSRRERGEVLPGRGCNNEAEIRALLAGLAWAETLGVGRLQVFSDSDFAVRQGRGEQDTAVARLAVLVAEARRRLAGFDAVELCWLPRHRNPRADALARRALGLKPDWPDGN